MCYMLLGSEQVYVTIKLFNSYNSIFSDLHIFSFSNRDFIKYVNYSDKKRSDTNYIWYI